MSMLPPPPPPDSWPAAPPPGAGWTPQQPVSGLPLGAPFGQMPPVAGPAPKLRPTTLGIWLSSVLMGLGVIAGLTIFGIGLLRISDRVDNFPRLDVGGAYEIEFSEAGDYVVYLEYDSGRSEPPIPDRLAISVSDEPHGDLNVFRYTNDVSFSFSGTAGRAVFKFEVPEAGVYRFESKADESSPQLMIGPSVLKAMVGPFLLGLAVGGVLFAIGLIWLIMTIVRRKKARRMRGSAPSSGVWAAGAPPMPFGTPSPPGPGSWTPPPGPPRSR